MASVLSGIGFAVLGASASVTSAVAVGAVVVAGVGAYAGGAFDSVPDGPAQIGTMVDKTAAQAKEELDAPLIADEKSRKRKKAASKSQFKVDKTEAVSGVNLQGTEKVSGVQL